MEVAKKNIFNIFIIICWVILVPVIAYTSSQEVKYTALLIGGVVGISVALISVLNYRAGYFISCTVALTVRLLERMSGTEIPVGVLIDAILLITLVGSLLKQEDNNIKKVDFLRDPAIITFYIYGGYILLQFFNPAFVYDRHGWTTFARVYVRNMVAMYLVMRIVRNMDDLKFYLKFWIIMLTIAAFYACIQQWFGLMPFEKAYIARYPEKFKTVLILTGIRIFSFVSDPAVFGVIMACGCIINIVLLTSSMKLISPAKKAFLVFSLILQFMALGFSGTRTAYVMVPMGLLIMVFVNMRHRNTIIGALVFVMAFLVLMFGPFHGNSTVIRMRSAFSGSEDASLNVREVNRHRIQPYIFKHPIGGGFLSCEPGSGSELDGFPPDSGYLRTVLEQGLIGLTLVLINIFIMMRYMVSNYFAARTETEKQFTLVILCVMFAIVVSMYAQESSGLIESALLYYGLNGITIKLKYLLSSPNITS
ncbi:O-antigen ligase family protein [Chitinophaga eiseniae]|uniref:O-antigen ligase family protein n=1 Tax=Chitinophaga eiseniae TaxID=634771 RepID=A0A847SP72_9BACT|nr:O-antigen ligase family protein [Chitinophaga eiseniae]NLR77822.1 O-antigen ligase family protein [Chitinophaga eiseniae]